MNTRLTRLRPLLGRLAAEFAIVVLGVTIALWADGWVATRADRVEELARLEALQQNISETLTSLHAQIENAAGAAVALRTLAQLDGERPLDSDDVTTLRYAMLFGSAFAPELNVYDDLKNSGELALLTDSLIRAQLATMESRLERVRLAQADLATIQQLSIDSYNVDHMDMRILYSQDIGLDPVNLALDPGFLRDIRFRNRVLLKLDLVTVLQGTFSDAETALLAVQESIEERLSAS